MKEPAVVVAGAIVSGGQLLLAQRSRPPELAGLWELPGGKVEPGETPEVALRRELREELGVDTSIGARLREEVALKPGLVLHAYRASIVSGTAAALEHSRLRWVDARGLADAALVDADRAWVSELSEMLRQPEPS